MRILKLIVALILPAMMAVALALPLELTRLWAQLPPGNQYLVPQLAPTSVPSLAQPAATTGIPPLATIPTPVPAASATAARTFTCSCFGPGSGTSWIGQIGASGYFAARQGATGACLAYNQRREPSSPFNYATSYSGAALAPRLPGASLPADAASAPVTPGTLNFSTAAQLQMCAQCTCN
jgi:hypothetical protein